MLQVLTGTKKGRKLKVPKGKTVRPTTSRIKKSIFDTLGNIENTRVLDIFAGSGGLGIEALSRGSSSVTFIENNPLVLKILKENISNCGFGDRVSIINLHFEGAIKKLIKKNEKYDLIFIDPPFFLYENNRVGDFISNVSECVDNDGRIVIEHVYPTDDTLGGFVKITRTFGGNRVSFFRKESE